MSVLPLPPPPPRRLVRCRNQACNRVLTDPESIRVGYGPDCAHDAGLTTGGRVRGWRQDGPTLLDHIHQENTVTAVIETFRRLPTTIDTMLWDGTPERANLIRAWVGRRDNGEPRFLTPGDITGVWRDAHVWNSEEQDWFAVPVGHRVARGALGEFYPISPAAVDATYEPVTR